MKFLKRSAPPQDIPAEEPQYPHCDTRILHAPGECEYCDRHPDWQLLRQRWQIAFTGHPPQEHNNYGLITKELPCPADFNRPPGSSSDHQQWYGNVAKDDG